MNFNTQQTELQNSTFLNCLIHHVILRYDGNRQSDFCGILNKQTRLCKLYGYFFCSTLGIRIKTIPLISIPPLPGKMSADNQTAQVTQSSTVVALTNSPTKAPTANPDTKQPITAIATVEYCGCTHQLTDKSLHCQPRYQTTNQTQS